MARARSYCVRNSRIHGRGVFAARTIRKNTKIIEYAGRRITEAEASEQPTRDPKDPYHTFLFRLSDGAVIDAGTRGNAARWINHSCAPNSESIEYDDGTVFIHAIRTIRKGEEIVYDYRLCFDGAVSARRQKQYACSCNSDNCRGTILLVKKKRRSR